MPNSSIVKRLWSGSETAGHSDYECVDTDTGDIVAYTCGGTEYVEFYAHGVGVTLTLERARKLADALAQLTT